MKCNLFIKHGNHHVTNMFDFLGNYKRVEELVTTVDVNKQNNVGDTALIRASETGKHVEL